MNIVHDEIGAGGTRFSRDALRERALAVAREILTEQGLSGLNARKVASGMGVAVGTLYNLFESFDTLILRLNLATLSELEAALAADRDCCGDPEAAVMAIARTYLDFTTTHRNEWTSVLQFSPKVRRFMDEFQATAGRLITQVEQAIAPLFVAGNEADRRIAAAVLWTSIEGINTLSVTNNVWMVVDVTAFDMAQSLVSNYLRGLGMRER